MPFTYADSKELEDNVAHGLGLLMRAALVSLESERVHPTSNADVMDARIAFYSERVSVLRELRENFENEMAKTAGRGW